MARNRLQTLAAAMLALMCLAAISVAADTAPAVAGESQLRQITQQLLDAVAPGDKAVWQRYLDEQVIHVDENGALQTKAQLLADLTPLPAGLIGRIDIATFQVQRFGAIAVTTHEDQEHLDYHGQALNTRFRSVDTWIEAAAGWRLIAEQTLVLLRDPPVHPLTAEQLCAYNGIYALTPDISVVLQCTGDGLRAVRAGRDPVLYLPELADIFFVAAAPRTRRIFLRDGQGRITGFVDRREGEDVRWIRRP